MKFKIPYLKRLLEIKEEQIRIEYLKIQYLTEILTELKRRKIK